MGHSPDGAFTAEGLLAAITTVSRSFDNAPLATLEALRDELNDHFMAVINASGRSLKNATEQRVLGILLAEIEVTIEERSDRLEAVRPPDTE